MSLGRRTIHVSTWALVEFMKNHNDQERTYTIEGALPDDVRIVGEHWLVDGRLAIVLESSEWAGIDDRPLDPPIMTIHWHPMKVTA